VAAAASGMTESLIHRRMIVASLIGVWALIGLQRFAPGFMAPFVMAEFRLNNTQWGVVTGALAFAWAFGALFAGFIADRFGPKPTILVAGFISALLGWTVGLVQSLGQLVGARMCLGLAEGALWPAVTAAIALVVPPARYGRTVAILIASFLVVGLTIGAPLVTYLGSTVGWRWSFFIVSAPLFVLTLIVWRYFDSTRATLPREAVNMRAFLSALRSRNVLLSAGISVCFISRMFIIAAFGTIYLSKVHGFSVAEAGSVLGPSLFGDVVGTLFFGWVSDRTGRRKSLLMALSLGAACAGAAFALLPVGASAVELMAALFLFTFFAGGVTPLMLVIVPTEAVGRAHAASAIGIANFSGEFFGAGLLPILGGYLGDTLGLRSTVLLAAILAGMASVLALGLVKPPSAANDEQSAPAL
jgi:predicted MFS family arabinose efflux permease